MGFVITEAQRQAVLECGIEAVPETIMAVLSANKARVLDFFRHIDVNRDGLISEGEFAFALSSLGLSVSVKDASRAFCSLDPDGSGTVEFSELQRAFLDKDRWKLPLPPPPTRTLTPAQRSRQAYEAKVGSLELQEDLYAFEITLINVTLTL